MILKTNECMYISKLIGDSSSLSLFNSLNVSLDGTEEESLIKKEILRDGKLTKESLDILEIVSKSEKSSKMILNDQNYIIEKYSYMFNDKKVLVENVDGELNFSEFDEFTDISEELSEFFGISILKNTDININIKIDELVVLLSLIDIYRQNELIKIARFDAELVELNKENLISEIKEPLGTSISKLIQSKYDIELLDEEKINEAIESLIGKGHIQKDLTLNESLKQFTITFLIPDLAALLEQYQINEKGELVIVSGFILSAGLRNKLLLLFTDEGVEMSALSSLESLNIIENFLKL